jgi:signal transduction histidine kinase
VVALVQVLLLGFSLGFLVLKLRTIRSDLTRLEREEQGFLNQLGESEGDLYRTAILLRDNIILDGPPQQRARQELTDLLDKMSDRSVEGPPWLSPEMRKAMKAVGTAKHEYLMGARTVISWKEEDRHKLGPQFLVRQLAPMREKFVETARESAGLVRSLRRDRNVATVQSIDGLQTQAIRILGGAAVLGLCLFAFAVWRFNRYEKERDVHMRNLHQAEEGLRALSLRLVESQELERKIVSRELHDEVGQILTALRVQIGQIEPAGAESKSHLSQASELAERSLRSVREMARGLRPAMLDDLGLAPALKWLGRDVSKNSVLDVDVRIEGEFAGLDEQRRTCLYRVVQEALTNCVKHSGAMSARVLLHENPGEVVLTVEDGGVGFTSTNGSGIGLLGMRERVEELGGEFAVVSSPGSGTVVRANLPKVEKS